MGSGLLQTSLLAAWISERVEERPRFIKLIKMMVVVFLIATAY